MTREVLASRIPELIRWVRKHAFTTDALILVSISLLLLGLVLVMISIVAGSVKDFGLLIGAVFATSGWLFASAASFHSQSRDRAFDLISKRETDYIDQETTRFDRAYLEVVSFRRKNISWYEKGHITPPIAAAFLRGIPLYQLEDCFVAPEEDNQTTNGSPMANDRNDGSKKTNQEKTIFNKTTYNRLVQSTIEKPDFERPKETEKFISSLAFTLNYFELIAISVNQKETNEDILRDFYYNILTELYEVVQPFLTAIRNEPFALEAGEEPKRPSWSKYGDTNRDAFFKNFEALALDWKARGPFFNPTSTTRASSCPSTA